MKITKRQLKRIIKEEKQKLLNETRVTNDSQGEVIGPFEYKLAAAIASAYEQHELSQEAQGATQGTYPTWRKEVDKAAADLEEALLDSGVLDSLLSLVDAIAAKLHNGEYSPQDGEWSVES